MAHDNFKIILFLFAFGAYLIFEAFRRSKRSREVKDLALSKLATAPQGLIEVEGFAWPRDNQVSKDSAGYDVVYQKFELQLLSNSGFGSDRKKNWETVFQKFTTHPFHLVDPTGLAIVDPSNCEVELGERTCTDWKKLTRERQSFVLSNVDGVNTRLFPPSGRFFGLFDARFRVVELGLRAGSPLYIAGELSGVDENSKLVAEIGLTSFFKLVMNASTRTMKDSHAVLAGGKAAKLTADEISTGYANCAKTVRASAQLKGTDESLFNIYGELKTSSFHKLYLAAFHRRQLAEKLDHYFIPRLVGGIVAVAIALTMVAKSMKTVHIAKTGESKIKAAPSEIAGSREQLIEFHKQCFAGKLKSCERLLYQRDLFELSPEYVTIYENASCKAGGQYFCPEINRGTASVGQ